MNYYIWEDDLVNSSEQAVLSELPEPCTSGGIRFDAGVLVSADLDLPLRVNLGPESLGRTLTDHIMTYGQWALLVTGPLKNVFDGLGIDNIQWFPLVVSDELQGREISDYWVGNVVGLIECVDWSEAKIDEFEAFFEKLWLDTSRIPRIDIFRQAGFAHHLIVSETVKNAVESGGFSGVKFVPANGYEDE